MERGKEVSKLCLVRTGIRHQVEKENLACQNQHTQFHLGWALSPKNPV
jgi:hypothetical protein